ncbi:Rap1a/Tai family immunity protein [Zwartia vadi]|uniref:Rap1a/Tai family immunity protein n=1 Tax=Zwartia vadi TaxID=3058168 RepID=UPI0025B5BCD1|nr:Rap1a/Tai family immunity protein [Zwartia vadi]MDN3988680.1 Rap1a/Tai family immunity protein [Zwartia vadi]
MKKIIALTCLAFASASTAMAEQQPKASTSTAQLVSICQQRSDVAAQNFCHGFGQGVFETYLISRHEKKAPPFICAEGTRLSRQEHLDNFIQWTAANPKFNQLSAADTILRYLGETYPCKKG